MLNVKTQLKGLIRAAKKGGKADTVSDGSKMGMYKLNEIRS